MRYLLPLVLLSLPLQAAWSASLADLDPAELQALRQQLDSAGGASLRQRPAPDTTTPTVVVPKEKVAVAPSRHGSGLAPYGYDLFAGVPSTFAPATEIPVTKDYLIGPGDTVYVQLFGKQNAEYSLVVSRDGTIRFPGIGALPVAGLTFDELQQLLERNVSEQFIGVKASITMGPLRSVRVFVLGDVQRPGAYTVSALSTMTNALFVSGGIGPIGSLRRIELKRDGRRVTTLDLYDLLLQGDTSHDARIQPGDVIFVPPVGQTVAIAGKVRRPAVYELRDEHSLAELVELAGGLLPDAYPDEIRIERINAQRERVLRDVDFGTRQGRLTALRDGDQVQVYSVLEKMDNIVRLSGHVYRPLAYEWHRGLRLSDLIPDDSVLKADADLHYVLVKRRQPPLRRLEVLTADLAQVFAAPGGADDLPLQPGDEVLTFGIGEARQPIIEGLLARLAEQAQQGEPARVVSIGGHVRFPGRYPLVDGMRVSQLLHAAGGLKESAYTLQAELTHHVIAADGEGRTIRHIEVALDTVLEGQGGDRQLSPHDHLTVHEMPQWHEQEYVELLGEVRFPGRYPISRGERLSSVLERAGGLTEQAFVSGAVFLREQLRQREQRQLDRMSADLEAELASMTLEERRRENADQQQVYQFANSLLERIKQTRAAGRLVLDPQRIFAARPGSQEDILLKDGDRLVIPARMEEVSVLGEVFFPTSHLYLQRQDRDDYINQSGGLTSRADAKRIYVIRANGAVESGRRGLFGTRRQAIQPGDTIVVPMDVSRVSGVQLWTDVSQILYQLAVTAASLKTVGVF